MPLYRLTACLIALATLPALAAPEAARWDCRTRDAAGDCVGLSTYTEPDGTRLSGLRSKLGGEPGWYGLLVRYHANGERSECMADATGACQGEASRYRRNGMRETGTLVQRNGKAAWTGRMTTRFPNGDSLDCAVNAQGDCDGDAVLRWHDGGRIQGRIVNGRDGPAWQGRVARHYPGGDREECEASPAGLCQGATTYTFADGSRLIGRKTLRGGHAVWTGEVQQLFTSGKRMRCDAARDLLCEEDTQIPVDDNGKPLGRIPR